MLSELLMWNKIGRIINILSKRMKLPALKVMDMLYHSQTNRDLHDSETMLYTYGDEYIVDEFMHEIGK